MRSTSSPFEVPERYQEIPCGLVFKNMSTRTSMIGIGKVLSDEEIWAIIQYERGFSGGHGPGMRRHERGRGPMMGAGD